MRYVFLILVLILLARKKARTHIILAHNFMKNNADSRHKRFIFLISISIFLTRKITKANNILAQNFSANNADYR
jgi:hypothetical protein